MEAVHTICGILDENSEAVLVETPLIAIETNGTIDENHQLSLDQTLPITGPKRVRVIVLYSPNDEIVDAEWLYAASRNPAFEFLKEPEEDIYTLKDGTPFHDKV